MFVLLHECTLQPLSVIKQTTFLMYCLFADAVTVCPLANVDISKNEYQNCPLLTALCRKGFVSNYK